MNYLHHRVWYDVPVYASYPACHLLAIEYTIPLAPAPARDQRAAERNWRKVWTFVRAEGLVRTWRKIQSKRIQEQLSSDFHIVLAAGTILNPDNDKADSAGAFAVCLGTRHPRCAEVMLFQRQLTMQLAALPPDIRCLQIVKELAQAISSAEWDRIAGYNFYSDMPPPAEGIEFVRRVALSLAAQVSIGQAPATNDGSSTRYQVIRPPVMRAKATDPKSSPGASIIGAGDYVRTQAIPALKKAGVQLNAIVDIDPLLVSHAKRECGFDQALTDWREAVQQKETEMVIVASYHDSHAQIAASALELGKKVFVEKPPAVTREDLALLLEAARAPNAFLEVGFNRRYAPFTRRTKDLLSTASGPTTITCIVKEVEIPDQHWYYWPKEGTRVTGNLCHWIDLAIYLLGPDSHPIEMTVSGPATPYHPDEERILNVIFRDGSSVTVAVTVRGDSTMGVQELIDVRRGDLSIRIDDYRRLVATRAGRVIDRRTGWRDKGHDAMYREALRRMKNNSHAQYASEDLRRTTLLTVTATEMIRSGLRSLSLDFEPIESES